MTTADGRGKSRRDTLLPIILCLCFIGSSIIFLVQMILKSQKENVAYLYDAANQTRTSILKQIEGDWQTLEGLAVSLRELVILDENDQVIRPASLWNDGRTTKETDSPQ